MIFGFMTFDDMARVFCFWLCLFMFCVWLLWKRATDALKNNPDIQEKLLRKGSSWIEEYLRKRFGG